MKQLVVIKSVKCRVRYDESKVKRLINKQARNIWWRFQKRCKPSVTVDGFATFASLSVTVPLSGIIEIAFLAATGKIVVLQVPSSTQFFVTCVERNNCFTTDLAVSLS